MVGDKYRIIFDHYIYGYLSTEYDHSRYKYIVQSSS